MSVKATSETMRSYLDALVGRGGFADYFTDDVTWTTSGHRVMPCVCSAAFRRVWLDPRAA